jgi:hypothetical protein
MVKIELDGGSIEHVTEFTYAVNMISEYKSAIEIKMHKYNKLNNDEKTFRRANVTRHKTTN